MHTLLCLVRHGVTDWNYEGRAQGHVDIPLNAEGIQQARWAASKLAMEPWDAIFSSTASRAYDTARLIAQETGHATVKREPRLVERNMGLAEGCTAADRALRWPGLGWADLPGTESDADLAARATAALTDIAQRHPGGRVICVAHGGLIHTFLRSIVPPGATPMNMHQRNTAITRVRYDQGMFRQEGPPDFEHILISGVEFSGEKGRIRGEQLAQLWRSPKPAHALDSVVWRATAVESAWSGERLVGFARCFTDGVLHGYIDLVTAASGYEHLTADLIQRLQRRYPDIAFAVTYYDTSLRQSGD